MRPELKIPKADEYKDFLELKIYKHWWEFTNMNFSSKSIFRGHSNFNKPQFNIWETKSSFHRQFKDCGFWVYYSNYENLITNVDLYENHLKPFLNGVNTKDLMVLQILQLFQHYGIATPLIDFTKNSDTALYFAFSNLFNQGVMSISEEDAEKRFITIIELKVGLLLEKSIIKLIGDNHFKNAMDLHYGQFFYYEPEVKLNNKNIELQDGAFLYLDSESCVEDFILDQIIQSGYKSQLIEFDEKPIVWHIIPYSSLDFNHISKEEFSVFAYLLHKKKLGCYLFNDIRGIESDMKNSNIKISCIKNPEGCECLQKLLASDILRH